jgi:hypothetical protein
MHGARNTKILLLAMDGTEHHSLRAWVQYVPPDQTSKRETVPQTQIAKNPAQALEQD